MKEPALQRPTSKRPDRTRLIPQLLACPVFAASCACRRSPSFNILGSFFPGWILCSLVAILVTTLLHLVLYRRRLEGHIKLLPLVYVSLTFFFACVFWLLFFE